MARTLCPEDRSLARRPALPRKLRDRWLRAPLPLANTLDSRRNANVLHAPVCINGYMARP